ncbi:DUF6776 family protein [Teredinibacter franksiae]|jgi:hypothetical protein|uniref:DUF6776 family protein n=1 Tax=Teredinibacter franksiae TaxID=2761453 RepID=UPI0016273E1B|nr:DUF6776 family protein [Teredinibacter franksiae]
MTVVKGSKHYPLRVVEYRPWTRVLMLSVLLIIVGSAVMFSYYLGHREGMAGQEQALEDAARLKVELESTSGQLEQLEQKVANVNIGAEVDRQANESVRQEVIVLKEQVAQLEEDNSFYRNLMAPTGNKRGLTFGAVEIVDTDAPRTYSFKIVMQQLATNHQLLNGTLTFNVVGRLNGVEATFNLNQLSEQVNQETVRLRFKYFQTIQGRMSLPAEFEPERIELVAKSTGKKPVTIEKRFGWLVEES